ncbi:hypothetical protein METBIDRAFT_217139 [Metschnikowia bicuspidata var. bicuspidata NRRL YB-4993]|uniref:Uncharacterized protein n=1 Tax=Metschnikowia bicuspidata var. bicuspidata NRRL YB-4993 TaxID=869754 RepID=A0A1A0H6P1_9ASCO|nr:hypothetical protein METBIDRAFT_217139 [Metschnikowia bicuspidata var. bicuspidata NRRL YB-4993]OBA19577.1 hypothetical protein METBIDRAFT_217139 [Metschnikowia bicuspidata var. bicuspidata NRRL YB-4993]
METDNCQTGPWGFDRPRQAVLPNHGTQPASPRQNGKILQQTHHGRPSNTHAPPAINARKPRAPIRKAAKTPQHNMAAEKEKKKRPKPTSAPTSPPLSGSMRRRPQGGGPKPGSARGPSLRPVAIPVTSGCQASGPKKKKSCFRAAPNRTRSTSSALVSLHVNHH